MLGVFLVSAAVVHEYIFCFVLGFSHPRHAVALPCLLEVSLASICPCRDIPREESWRFQTDGRGHIAKTEGGVHASWGKA